MGIVQFTYGDDGLDPELMEGKNGDVLNFDRLMLRVRHHESAQASSPTDEPYLHPYEVLEHFERWASGDVNKSWCTERTLENVSTPHPSSCCCWPCIHVLFCTFPIGVFFPLRFPTPRFGLWMFGCPDSPLPGTVCEEAVGRVADRCWPADWIESLQLCLLYVPLLLLSLLRRLLSPPVAFPLTVCHPSFVLCTLSVTDSQEMLALACNKSVGLTARKLDLFLDLCARYRRIGTCICARHQFVGRGCVLMPPFSVSLFALPANRDEPSPNPGRLWERWQPRVLVNLARR